MNLKQQQSVYWVLRVAVAMCFIGHGAFGIITKPIWCNYFGVFGIDKAISYQLMPVVGTVDILLGAAVLVYPVRAIPAWLIGWGLITALLRPLSGEPFPEFIERAGNYGTPLALLLLTGVPVKIKGWFTRMQPPAIPDDRILKQVSRCLRFVVFLLLLGHGLLNIMGKKGLLDQYSSVGFAEPARVALTIGLFEIAIAGILLARPVRPLIFLVFLWKMTSELFYPHYELFEWVERGGSYGALLALWMITEKTTVVNTWYRSRSLASTR